MRSLTRVSITPRNAVYARPQADVERVVVYPFRGRYQPKVRDRSEQYGFSSEGRLLTVVTNRAVTVVITVIDNVEERSDDTLYRDIG